MATCSGPGTISNTTVSSSLSASARRSALRLRPHSRAGKIADSAQHHLYAQDDDGPESERSAFRAVAVPQQREKHDRHRIRQKADLEAERFGDGAVHQREDEDGHQDGEHRRDREDYSDPLRLEARSAFVAREFRRTHQTTHVQSQTAELFAGERK